MSVELIVLIVVVPVALFGVWVMVFEGKRGY